MNFPQKGMFASLYSELVVIRPSLSAGLTAASIVTRSGKDHPLAMSAGMETSCRQVRSLLHLEIAVPRVVPRNHARASAVHAKGPRESHLSPPRTELISRSSIFNSWSPRGTSHPTLHFLPARDTSSSGSSGSSGRLANGQRERGGGDDGGGRSGIKWTGSFASDHAWASGGGTFFMKEQSATWI